LLRSFGLNQQQRVVELHVGVTEPKTLKCVAGLPVGGSEEVLGSGSLNYSLL
jgi:hypothetical protein